MTKAADLWLAEYSLTQDAMHVEQLSDAIRNSAEMIQAGESNDYMIIGAANSHDEASAICEALRDRLNDCELPRIGPRRVVTCQFCGISFLAVNLTFCFVCEHMPEMCATCMEKHELTHSPAEESKALTELMV